MSHLFWKKQGSSLINILHDKDPHCNCPLPIVEIRPLRSMRERRLRRLNFWVPVGTWCNTCSWHYILYRVCLWINIISFRFKVSDKCIIYLLFPSFFTLPSFFSLLIENREIDSLLVSYRVVLEVAGNSDAVILSGLEADTQYQVTVAALWGGHKYRSRPIVFRTLGKWRL